MCIDPLLFFLCLGILGWVLISSSPTSPEYREAVRDQRFCRIAEKAAARAQRQAARAARQAWRRRIFGSHPVLYGALFWASPVIFMTLLGLAVGR